MNNHSDNVDPEIFTPDQRKTESDLDLLDKMNEIIKLEMQPDLIYHTRPGDEQREFLDDIQQEYKNLAKIEIDKKIQSFRELTQTYFQNFGQPSKVEEFFEKREEFSRQINHPATSLRSHQSIGNQKLDLSAKSEKATSRT